MQQNLNEGSQALTTLQAIIKKKDELCNERDLCAELYNLWITKLHDFQNDPKKYAIYQRMIENLEPYTQTLKEQIREINRDICELEGVQSIGDTQHTKDCVYKYGFDKPKG